MPEFHVLNLFSQSSSPTSHSLIFYSSFLKHNNNGEYMTLSCVQDFFTQSRFQFLQFLPVFTSFQNELFWGLVTLNSNKLLLATPPKSMFTFAHENG